MSIIRRILRRYRIWRYNRKMALCQQPRLYRLYCVAFLAFTTEQGREIADSMTFGVAHSAAIQGAAHGALIGAGITYVIMTLRDPRKKTARR